MRRMRILFIAVAIAASMFGCARRDTQTTTQNADSTAFSDTSVASVPPAPHGGVAGTDPGSSGRSSERTSSDRYESRRPTETAQARIVIPAGTEMVASLDQTLSTKENEEGDGFTATVTEAVRVRGETVIPSGSTIRGHLVESDRAPRVGGKAELELSFDEVETPGGSSYDISAENLVLEGKNTTKGDVEKVVGGTVGGAILGGILGGKKGAARGAAVGGAAGAVIAVATRGQDIVLDSGTRVSVTLRESVEVRQRSTS